MGLDAAKVGEYFSRSARIIAQLPAAQVKEFIDVLLEARAAGVLHPRARFGVEAEEIGSNLQAAQAEEGVHQRQQPRTILRVHRCRLNRRDSPGALPITVLHGAGAGFVHEQPTERRERLTGVADQQGIDHVGEVLALRKEQELD